MVSSYILGISNRSKYSWVKNSGHRPAYPVTIPCKRLSRSPEISLSSADGRSPQDGFYGRRQRIRNLDDGPSRMFRSTKEEGNVVVPSHVPHPTLFLIRPADVAVAEAKNAVSIVSTVGILCTFA